MLPSFHFRPDNAPVNVLPGSQVVDMVSWVDPGAETLVGPAFL